MHDYELKLDEMENTVRVIVPKGWSQELSEVTPTSALLVYMGDGQKFEFELVVLLDELSYKQLTLTPVGKTTDLTIWSQGHTVYVHSKPIFVYRSITLLKLEDNFGLGIDS